MFQADIRIFNESKTIIHEFHLTLAVLPREYDRISIIHIGHPHYAALIARIQRVYWMLDARSEEPQTNLAVLARLIDYVDEDVTTVIVQPKRLN